MKIVVDAIATLGFLNEKGVFDLDIKSSRSISVGNMIIEQGKELPGYNEKI